MTADTVTPERVADEPKAVGSALSPEGPESPQAIVLELKDLAVRLGKRELLTGVDLELEEGRFMALLGPNGVGKTTLLKVILGMIPASSGTARVLGKPPGQENHRIGFLPQRRSFDARLRIRGTDIVRLGLDGDRWGVPLPGAALFSSKRRAEDAHLRDVIELVGASKYADRPIGEISGGEQQRLLIAQALVRDPALLLLDEPLDGLDLPSQASITALLSRICRENRIALLMVAHDVNPLLPYLDAVAYIARGQLISGLVDQVVTSETLCAVYGTHVEVVHTPDGHVAVLGQPEAGIPCRGSQYVPGAENVR